MGRLQGKVALVSGSGRGIGRAVALKLSREGVSVVVNDLDDGPGNAVVEEIEASGGKAVAVNGNVNSPDIADRFIAAALENFGGIDIIVNNAGYTWDNVIQKMTDDQWQAMIDVHLTAPFRILRAAQPAISDLYRSEAKTGAPSIRKVVNTSSISGLFGNVGQTGYASAKAGVVGMTQTLAKEWGRIGVTVNCVAYGLIKTRLTADAGEGKTIDIDGRDIRVGLNSDLMDAMERSIPLRRAGTPEDAAGAVFMFCQPESDYVSGQTLLCAGGLTGI